MHDRLLTPFDDGVLAEPYSHYRRLRDEAPCHKVDEPRCYIISRYDDVAATLRNYKAFSSTGGVGLEWKQRPMMSMFDPPKHTRLRRIVQPYFGGNVLESFLASFMPSVDSAVRAFVGRREGDWVKDLAEPIVAEMIGRLIGVPEAVRHEFRHWAVHILDDLSYGKAGRRRDDTYPEARKKLVDCVKEVIATERAHAGGGPPNVVRAMLNAPGDGLTEQELVAFCVLLLVAGFETTVNGLGNVMNAMIVHEQVWPELLSEGERVSPFIEEALRWDPPIQAFFRNTLLDVEVAGVCIPANEKVMVLFGATGRDERHYPDPDSFSLDRNPVDNLSFGGGIHHCIGAPLARKLYSRVLEQLLACGARPMPAGPSERLVNILARGFVSLPVVFERTAA